MPGVAGHITLRDPVDPTTFWVNPFGTAVSIGRNGVWIWAHTNYNQFSHIKASDLIQVDHHGKLLCAASLKRSRQHPGIGRGHDEAQILTIPAKQT